MGIVDSKKAANLLKSASHPCFSGCGGGHSRIHLPVAPACNIQCNYCVRKYDCPNESRPGVTAKVLSPREALDRYMLAKERIGKPDVVGVAGPGDALANFETLKETLTLVRDAEPDITFCISTNGLALPRYAGELEALGISHVTVTVNAVEPLIGRRIYRHVFFNGRNYKGIEAAEILLENQLEGIRRIVELGMVCKVNVVMLAGINDAHIPEVVKTTAGLGADISNIMQLIPVKGSIFEHLPLVSNASIMRMRKRCESILPQMYHCRQCRADAAGTLDNDISLSLNRGAEQPVKIKHNGPEQSMRFAVASKNGYLVDMHFGHTAVFYVFEYSQGRVTLFERREIPRCCSGPEECGEHGETMKAAISVIEDCMGVIAVRIGEKPRAMLAEKGIGVFLTYDYAVHAVGIAAEQAAEGGSGKKPFFNSGGQDEEPHSSDTCISTIKATR
ncbi:MAG: radical SAM protein [Spirochaetaceae bacterium]|jgi:MoaA/NifB/PqqE/SkfB family radical SAM enzyme|nr:radical SAM protein [Spirochaetaceae bacterium]